MLYRQTKQNKMNLLCYILKLDKWNERIIDYPQTKLNESIIDYLQTKQNEINVLLYILKVKKIKWTYYRISSK